MITITHVYKVEKCVRKEPNHGHFQREDSLGLL